jgi:fructokinase
MVPGEHDNRPIMFGEVLFDMFPDGSVVLGGAPFNVAWHLQAFGLEPLLISRVGTDALGRRVCNSMLEWGMDRAGLQIDSAHPTGTVTISINDGEPEFDIVPDRAYDYIDRYSLPPYWTSRPLYYGTMAMRNPVSKETLWELKNSSEGFSFMDVNLRPPWWSLDEVMQAMRGASCIKLNQDELNKIVQEGATVESKVEWLLANISPQSVLVTQGKEGAMIFQSDGTHSSVAPHSALTLVDTVGAGDAFSSIILMGQIKGWPIGITLERAQSFASAIVGVRGAVVNEREFYHKFLQQWLNSES